MSKAQMIVVESGELYVFGKLISRHPEMPWLFNITDVYKACEVPLTREAKKYGKDHEVYFDSKQPVSWVKRNTHEYTIEATAKELKKRMRKYGVTCGFGLEGLESNLTAVRLLSNKDLCIKSIRGNTKLRGTYVCQDFVTDYAGFLNATLKAKINSTFISVLNGYTEEVTKKAQNNERIAKGTQTRTDNIELNNRLVEACGLKKVLPMKVQEGINEGVLGMTATKYKKLHGIKEPFNDNLNEAQLDMKNAGISLATYSIRTHQKPSLTHMEGKQIGKDSGIYATLVMTNPEVKQLLETLSLKLKT